MSTSPISPPLCVDLDGTLLKSDILVETTLLLLKRNPLYLLLLPVWLMRGKAWLKRQIAERVQIDVTTLPYHPLLLEYLREQKSRGRGLVLATATHEKYARQIADHLGLFNQVLATSDGENFSGQAKDRRLCEIFGERGFEYAANSGKDLAVWAQACAAVVVSAPDSVTRRVRAVTEVKQVFARQKPSLRLWLSTVRPHQWVKNLLVFIPLIAAHRVTEWLLLADALVAFVAYSLCASSVYVLNDLLDLQADRHHPRKRLRAFATGDISIVAGLILSGCLLLLSFALAFTLPGRFLLVLAGYYGLTLLYSLKLKEVPMLDVVVLAGLYTMRIIAGAAATTIVPSFWLLAFSMFLFLSLAMVKRVAELQTLEDNRQTTTKGRGYRLGDHMLIKSQGAASGYLSVLVLALYIHNESSSALYSHPKVMWLLCPLLLYWISYVWLKAYRNEMHDDPVVFALRDPVSLGIGLIGMLIVWAAI